MKNIFTFLFVLIFPGYGFSQENDSASIVRVLEKESATWRSGDSTAHASCWKLEPYSTVIVMTADGKTFGIPADKVIHPAPGMIGQGGSSKNSNYVMNIHGNTAIVTHNESSTDVNGHVGNSYEIRMLEKTNDGWKLTGQIIQLF
ncbi:MAG: hypothetical protein ABIY62_00970 [Ginsengibacter sp.]